MIGKLILVVSNYFTFRDYKRHGIEIFESNDFDVEVWDLSKFLSSKTVSAIEKTSTEQFSTVVKRFNKMSEVLESIKTENKKTFFLTTIMYSYNTMSLFKNISKFGFKYGATGPYTLNLAPHLSNLSRPFSIYNYTFNSFCKAVLNRIISNRIFMKLQRIRPAKVFFAAGGQKVQVNGPIISENTSIIKCSSSDYDFFSINKLKRKSQTYILFLDQYIPYHPDFIQSNYGTNVYADSYYKELRTVFSKIEKLTNLKVIISAHPKAYYHDKQHLFGNRTIHHNINSFDLVENSKFVLMHYSTSISMPVLLNIPVIFLSSNNFKNTIGGIYTEKLAQWFETEILDMNFDVIELESFYAKSHMYKIYIDNFLNPNSKKNVVIWDKVSNYIKKNYL